MLDKDTTFLRIGSSNRLGFQQLRTHLTCGDRMSVRLHGRWMIFMQTLFPENQEFNAYSKKLVHRYSRSCISMYLWQVFPAV
jgi:hypothetical protein